MRITETSPGRGLALSLQAALAGSAIAYWLIAFVLTANTLSPLHHDDYSILGAGLANLRLLVERPVSTNATVLMGAAGPKVAYVVQNVLTVLLPAAVLAFAFLLLRLRVNLLIALVFGVLVFCHPSALEHGKYLGLITNLTSHFFGILALFVLWWTWRLPSRRRLALAAAAYALTAFAKEDFLLPPLVLLAYFAADLWFPRAGTEQPDAVERKKWLVRIAAWFVGIAVASIAFNTIVNSPFTAGLFGGAAAAASPYAADFSPASVLATFGKLTFGYARAHTLAAVVAAVVLALLLPDRRREVLALVVVTISLVLPYSVIGNQAPAFRAFAWLPWLAAFVLAAAAALWQEGFARRGARLAARVAALAILVGAWAIGAHDRTLEASVAEWYRIGQTTTASMLRSLVTYRAFIEPQKVVGLVGLEGLSPWSKNSGAYLRDKLGYANKWVVFVDKPDLFYPLQEDATAYIAVLPTARMCEKPDLLVMRFDKNGNGTPFKASDLCRPGASGAPATPVAAARP